MVGRGNRARHSRYAFKRSGAPLETNIASQMTDLRERGEREREREREPGTSLSQSPTCTLYTVLLYPLKQATRPHAKAFTTTFVLSYGDYKSVGAHEKVPKLPGKSFVTMHSTDFLL